jgi:hypothetical protein
MPQTANLTATAILDGLNVSLRYAELLLQDIPAEKFTHMPHPTMNHPAFCIGHLALYPDKALKLVGMEDGVVEKPGYAELFEASATCVDDPDRYPPKDEVVAYFFDRYRAIQQHLPEVPESTLQQPFKGEGRAANMFQTVASAVNFYMNCHTMLHLGQISAWRRAVGLPPAM